MARLVCDVLLRDVDSTDTAAERYKNNPLVDMSGEWTCHYVTSLMTNRSSSFCYFVVDVYCFQVDG